MPALRDSITAHHDDLTSNTTTTNTIICSNNNPWTGSEGLITLLVDTHNAGMRFWLHAVWSDADPGLGLPLHLPRGTGCPRNRYASCASPRTFQLRIPSSIHQSLLDIQLTPLLLCRQLRRPTSPYSHARPRIHPPPASLQHLRSRCAPGQRVVRLHR